jgi:hypothetical protein
MLRDKATIDTHVIEIGEIVPVLRHQPISGIDEDIITRSGHIVQTGRSGTRTGG